MCARWSTAVTFWVVIVLDMIYFGFTFIFLETIKEEDCNEDLSARVSDPLIPATECDSFNDNYEFWSGLPLEIVFVAHLVIAIILCVWGCEGINLDKQLKEEAEEKKKSDQARDIELQRLKE